MEEHRYRDSAEIARWHGLFAVGGYWLLRPLNCIGLTRILFGLPRVCRRTFDGAFDPETEKSTAWWQDACVVVLFGVTAIITYIGAINTGLPRGLAWNFACWYLLFDKIFFHVRILWFDDLEINRTETRRKVWSHRRVLFQAIINYVESILIFASLYRQHMIDAGPRFKTLLHYSYCVATALTSPEWLNSGKSNGPPNWLVDTQVAVSIFFLVVVISIVASVGYSRPELAPRLSDGKPNL